jgi:hypothetical protein
MPGSRSSSFSSHKSSRSHKSSYSPNLKSRSPSPSPSRSQSLTPIGANSLTNNQMQQPGFFSNIMQGFGLGAGQSIAMNIFRSEPKISYKNENNEVKPLANLESLHNTEYTACIKDKWNNVDICKEYIKCLNDNKDNKDLCKDIYNIKSRTF